jgi:hypothetical protein
LWKRREIQNKFLIPSQIFNCKLHVITRHPDLGKTQTDSINWLALKPCYCTKAALAPWSQFNFESLLSENNGMSANLCQQFKRILLQHVSAVTLFALGQNSSLTQLQHACVKQRAHMSWFRGTELPYHGLPARRQPAHTGSQHHAQFMRCSLWQSLSTWSHHRNQVLLVSCVFEKPFWNFCLPLSLTRVIITIIGKKLVNGIFKVKCIFFIFYRFSILLRQNIFQFDCYCPKIYKYEHLIV